MFVSTGHKELREQLMREVVLSGTGIGKDVLVGHIVQSCSSVAARLECGDYLPGRE